MSSKLKSFLHSFTPFLFCAFLVAMVSPSWAQLGPGGPAFFSFLPLVVFIMCAQNHELRRQISDVHDRIDKTAKP